MIMNDGLLRVFWPYDLHRSSAPGVIVGWRNSEQDLFVLTVLEGVEVGCPYSYFNRSPMVACTDQPMRIASQCRRCPPCGHPVSEQPASHQSYLQSMWSLSDARSGHYKPTRISNFVQSLPPLCDNELIIEAPNTPSLLSPRDQYLCAGCNVPASAPDPDGIHVT